jgi:CDP-diglyceride synthetase
MKAKEIYMYALGAMIVLGIFAITVFVLYREMPATNKDLMLMILGVLLAKFADVIGYFYGSSKGSADKNAILGRPPDSTPPTP